MDQMALPPKIRDFLGQSHANSLRYDGLKIKCKEKECCNDVWNFVNPFSNVFSQEKFYKGRRMDYLGYLAHKMTGRFWSTEWKRENVFTHSLYVRAIPVVISTLVAMRRT